MSTFTIDSDNNITAYASAEEARQSGAAGLIPFDSQAALAKVSAEWPMSRFVEIWNGIPGQSPVKKFQDRKKAVTRIWAAIQALAGNEQPSEAAAGKPEAPRKIGKPAKTAKNVQPAKKSPSKPTGDKASDRSNKKAEVIAMMKRAKGATLAEIMEATAWQKHTVRGFVSLLGSKGGQTIESSKNTDGERTYKITN
jgi:uncharacterized protein DUF3489